MSSTRPYRKHIFWANLARSYSRADGASDKVEELLAKSGRNLQYFQLRQQEHVQAERAITLAALGRFDEAEKLSSGFTQKMPESIAKTGIAKERDRKGMEAELEFVYKFSYQAKFDNQGSENELCWVYLGKCGEQVQPNETEIAGTRFVAAEQLEAELEKTPAQFTPWFKMEWQHLRTQHGEQLARYTGP